MSTLEHRQLIMDIIDFINTSWEADKTIASPSNEEKLSESHQCYVCLDTFTGSEGEIMCNENEHFACYECARQVIERSLENVKEFPAACCPTNPWSTHTVWSIASTTIAEKYEDRLEEYNCPTWLRVPCARPDCTRFRQTKHHKLKGTKNDRVVVCLGCETSTCITCRKEWNENHLCERGVEEICRPPWLPIYTPTCRIKRCPHCCEWIEHDGGCNDMLCEHCGKYFCFVCLLIEPNGCTCPTAGDPSEGYDQEGYERSSRAIHRDTGLNRAGLNMLEIPALHQDLPPPAQSRPMNYEDLYFADPVQWEQLAEG